MQTKLTTKIECREIWEGLQKSFRGRMLGTGFLFFWSNLNGTESEEYKHCLSGTQKYVSYEFHH